MPISLTFINRNNICKFPPIRHFLFNNLWNIRAMVNIAHQKTFLL